METALGWIVFGIGWPVLIIGSIWMWRKASALTEPAATFLNVSLMTFYVLGYTCTMYWMGESWILGVIPAFVGFLALFIISLRTIAAASGPGECEGAKAKR